MIPLFTPDLRDYHGFADGCLEAGIVGPGPATQHFAMMLSTRHGSKPVLLTTSGTVALSIAALSYLMAETTILVPAYSVASVWNALTSVGFRVMPVDVDDTGRMDLDELVKVLENRKKWQHIAAVCYVDFNGQVDNRTITCREICDRYNVFMIEDSACALGHSVDPNILIAGTIGHVGILSFSPHKIVTTGQGGAVIFSNREKFDWATNYIAHGGMTDGGLVKQRSTNLRFNDILAQLGIAQMGRLEDLIEKRQDQLLMLRRNYLLGEDLVQYKSGPALFNLVKHPRAAELAARLQNAGVDARTQYHQINAHPYYHGRGDDKKFEGAMKFEQEALYLPFGLGMDEEQLDSMGRAYNTIKEWMK